ncbi:hypothetical protein [Consotaella aegiceratis]|uniref:hypothetical protein n=1 Tax=Consotaella aegiceratis TaxID=3097961 RepID=UPI002F3F5F96
MTDDDEAAIEDWLRTVTDDPDPTETLTFARWAARHAYQFEGVIRPLAPLLKRSLGPRECDQLIEGVSKLINRRGRANSEQRGALLLLRDTLVPQSVRPQPL